jgi:hypothetical protein
MTGGIPFSVREIVRDTSVVEIVRDTFRLLSFASACHFVLEQSRSTLFFSDLSLSRALPSPNNGEARRNQASKKVEGPFVWALRSGLNSKFLCTGHSKLISTGVKWNQRR